jgi:hypothetical protein
MLVSKTTTTEKSYCLRFTFLVENETIGPQKKETVYQIKKSFLRQYLILELKKPSISMGFA